MKIGIIGSRGIPNFYGGFEQFAQLLSMFLVESGAEVYVYNSKSHPYKEKFWKGVNIIHCFDPENKIGTIGQFIYDLNCIIDSRKRGFDLILQLGYTSSSIWSRLLPKKSIVVTNMDGLEWKRSKYNKIARSYLKYAEKLAVKSSNQLIADSTEIKKYLDEKYAVNAKYIAYGANVFENPDKSVLKQFGLESSKYFLLIARIQPDNHIEEIIKGVINSKTNYPLIVVGNHKNKYGRFLEKKYKNQKNIKFLNSIYDQDILNNLRYFSACYFHGHSAGGTNPSLLEAMAASALICAHNNVFNKTVLSENALYFETFNDITDIILKKRYLNKRKTFIDNNLKNVSEFYNWDFINSSYYQFFINLFEIRKL